MSTPPGLSGNTPSFERVVDAHYAPLYRFALSLVRSSADACDLVQATFLIYARRGDSLREADKVKTWLFTTLYREFLRIRRRSGRIQSIEDLPEGQREVAAEAIDTVRALDGQEALDALQQVPDHFREPLALFYLQNLSYKEIAAVLGIPIGTVMSRLSRGKAHLRQIIESGRTSNESSPKATQRRPNPGQQP